MDDNKAPSNIIQFPGKRKETESGVQKPAPENADKPQNPKKKRSKKNAAGTVLAIMLATVAVNRYAFQTSASANLSSQGAMGRGLASVDPSSLQRNADWEKELAERLASPQKRNVASVQVGRPATAEEKLRWGTLEEKYTITFRPDARVIESILLQNEGSSSPSYILSRDGFLKEYGGLLAGDFASAKLKSVQTVNDKTIESYTLFDKDSKPQAEARFELDQYKRLLSLKVEPAQI